MPFPIRIDATTLPALIFGSLLLVVAVIMGVLVWRARRVLDPILKNDDVSRLHADRQFRRRIQISVMLGLIGILIPVGDQFDKLFLARPALFFIWVASVFILTIWMVLMALGDWLSTVAYSAIQRSQLRHQRTELEEDIRRYHAAKNGRSHSLENGDES